MVDDRSEDKVSGRDNSFPEPPSSRRDQRQPAADSGFLPAPASSYQDQRGPIEQKKDQSSVVERLRERAAQAMDLAFSHQRRCRQLEQEASVLRDHLTRTKGELESVREEKLKAESDCKILDARLSRVMGQESLANRGNLSLAGTGSQPELLARELDVFRKKIEGIIRMTRTSSYGGDPKDYVARGVATLSEVIFRRGAELLCTTAVAEAMATEVRDALASQFSLVALGADTSVVQDAAFHGFELLRRIVISTAPSQPGILIFAAKGVPYSLDEHESWPGSSEDDGSRIALTIYPGYRVGQVLYRRPLVTTTPPMSAVTSHQRT